MINAGKSILTIGSAKPEQSIPGHFTNLSSDGKDSRNQQKSSRADLVPGGYYICAKTNYILTLAIIISNV